MDRTQMYRDRAQRNEFIDSLKEADADPGALYRELGIQVEIASASSSDLPRVTELINRTNQFNLRGARTTLQEVQAWHASDAHHVLSVRVADKFGDSGVVCICIAERSDAS
jgi:FkbH-like protein